MAQSILREKSYSFAVEIVQEAQKLQDKNACFYYQYNEKYKRKTIIMNSLSFKRSYPDYKTINHSLLTKNYSLLATNSIRK